MTSQMLVAQEKARYADFIGLQNQRIHLPVNIPIRIHIALAIALAAALLLRYRRNLLLSLVILIVPSILLWTTEVNPTSRYFVILAPFLTLLLVAGAVCWAASRSRLWAGTAVLVLIAFSQVAGNAYLLLQSRAANYDVVSLDLRKLIPKGAPVYGALTFWLACAR